MPESGENRSMLGQTLASELNIKVYKEISTVQGEIGETIDSIMMTCNEPQCGLTDAELAQAKELDSGSSMIEYFNDRPAITAAIIAVSSAGLAFIIYMMKNTRS